MMDQRVSKVFRGLQFFPLLLWIVAILIFVESEVCWKLLENLYFAGV